MNTHTLQTYTTYTAHIHTHTHAYSLTHDKCIHARRRVSMCVRDCVNALM